jgi:hypothetical protein
MTLEDRARSRARLAPVVGIGAGLGSLAWLQGAAIGATLGVLAVGAAELVPANAPEAPRMPSTTALANPPVEHPSALASQALRGATLASANPSSEPAAMPAAVPAESPPAPRASARAADAPSAAATEDPIAEEAALLERARVALGASAAEALAVTEAHAAKFPNGKLAMERELLAIDALRRLGRVAEARARRRHR